MMGSLNKPTIRHRQEKQSDLTYDFHALNPFVVQLKISIGFADTRHVGCTPVLVLERQSFLYSRPK